MVGTTLHYLFTGTKLFPTKTDDCDAIHPDHETKLVNWEGFPQSLGSSILQDCTDPAVSAERDQVLPPPTLCSPYDKPL